MDVSLGGVITRHCTSKNMLVSINYYMRQLLLKSIFWNLIYHFASPHFQMFTAYFHISFIAGLWFYHFFNSALSSSESWLSTFPDISWISSLFVSNAEISTNIVLALYTNHWCRTCRQYSGFGVCLVTGYKRRVRDFDIIWIIKNMNHTAG